MQRVSESRGPSPQKGPRRVPAKDTHEVVFVTYPKLLFIWPLILAGLVFYPFGEPYHPKSGAVEAYEKKVAF